MVSSSITMISYLFLHVKSFLNDQLLSVLSVNLHSQNGNIHSKNVIRHYFIMWPTNQKRLKETTKAKNQIRQSYFSKCRIPSCLLCLVLLLFNYILSLNISKIHVKLGNCVSKQVINCFIFVFIGVCFILIFSVFTLYCFSTCFRSGSLGFQMSLAVLFFSTGISQPWRLFKLGCGFQFFYGSTVFLSTSFLILEQKHIWPDNLKHPLSNQLQQPIMTMQHSQFFV